MKRLEGQVAIVTGGARGIGKGICEVFCREGATVALWDVLDGTETVNEITQNGGKIFFQKVDVTDQNSVDTAIEEIIKQHGKIEILINNAGIIRDRSFLKMSEEEWDSVINVNLKSLYVVTRAVVPHMKENGYGRIVSASSINGTAGAFGQTNYCATKAGISGFTRALCKEVGRFGITANAVAPGFIQSNMTDKLNDAQKNTILDKIPMKKLGNPEDIAKAVGFLCSDNASYITGQTIHVNGGLALI